MGINDAPRQRSSLESFALSTHVHCWNQPDPPPQGKKSVNALPILANCGEVAAKIIKLMHLRTPLR